MTFKQRWTNKWYVYGIALVAILMTIAFVAWEYTTGDNLSFWVKFGLDMAAFALYNTAYRLFISHGEKRQAREHH